MLVLLVICIGCSTQPEPVSEKDAIKTVEGFFDALDVENNDPTLIDKYVTHDFMLYEIGKKMTKEEFIEFVSGLPIIKSDWKLSDSRISTDINSAHISLHNTGVFLLQIDTLTIQQEYKWLESAYLVKELDSLKIKFYFSDNISVKTDTIK